MSLLLDEWPADEPPPPPPLARSVWPWLAGVAGAVALWMMILGLNPVSDAFTVVAIPTTLALLGIALLARTRLPGWAITLVHFVVLPLALLIPTGIVAVLNGSRGWGPLFEITYIYAIGCIWALTAILVTGLLTMFRLLARAAREGSKPSPTRPRLW